MSDRPEAEEIKKRFDLWFDEIKELGGTVPGVAAAALLTLAEVIREATHKSDVSDAG